MPDAIIENPILNSPFEEPTRHFKFTDDGITNEVVETRRLSGYFVPIPQPKKKGKQLIFRVDTGPLQGERVHQPNSRSRKGLASAGMAWHHQHLGEASAALVGPRA
jgi:type III restriction enzyme